LNAAFLAMAISCGLTSAITNPLEAEIRNILRAADVMMGRDENCATWLQANRPKPEAGSVDERAARRERRRQAREAGP
jgi:5-methyltetrahydrofolate--homocysteine methyltransferase